MNAAPSRSKDSGALTEPAGDGLVRGLSRRLDYRRAGILPAWDVRLDSPLPSASNLLVVCPRKAGRMPACRGSGTSLARLKRQATGVFFGLLSLAAGSAGEQAPALRPPRGELGPSLWEQHRWLFLALTGIVLAGFAAGLWWRRRSRPAAETPPDALARQALLALQGRDDDEGLALEVSRILRGFLTTAFGLPHEELTTAEFDRALRSPPAASEELVTALVGLLRECDVKKFAPVKPPALPNLVARALELIDRVEAERKAPPVAVTANA